MKKLIFTTLFFLAVILMAEAQGKRPSPPAEASGTINGKDITINYSQPAVKGRQVWGDLVPFDAVWRTGANEATWIEVSEDVTIEGETLKAGKYGLFTIPGEDEWTVIFNETWDQWGAYEYDSSKDVLRVTVSPEMVDDTEERLAFTITDDAVGFAWEKLRFSLAIQ